MTISEKLRGILFVLVGPGGAGKNALMREVMNEYNNQLRQLATATTRDIRPGEEQGREHQFVSPETFRQMIADGALLEWQEVTQDKFYGIPRDVVETNLNQGQNLIADIDVFGAQILKETYPDDIVLIFITVPGDTVEEKLHILRERMSKPDRNEDEALIEQRLERARTIELPFAPSCDHIIVNDVITHAAQELHDIVEVYRRQRSP